MESNKKFETVALQIYMLSSYTSY